MLESLDKLEKRSAGTISASTFGRIRDDLLASRAAVQKHVLEESDALRGVRRAIKCARSRVRRWGLRHKSWSAAYGGLERVYRHGYLALGAVTADPTTENLHEWRKQAKYLGYELKLLEGIRPKTMKKRARRVQKLTQWLGDDHDLAILRQKLSVSSSATREADGLNALFEAIDSRQYELRRFADILGRRVYARSPKAFRRRIERLETCG